MVLFIRLLTCLLIENWTCFQPFTFNVIYGIIAVLEFSNDRCASVAVSNDVDTVSFNQMCYEFNFGKGGSFEEARRRCQKNGGDLAHGFRGVTTSFLTGELERRKEKLKTQLVWIGAEKDPGLTSRTWRWVNGKY